MELTLLAALAAFAWTLRAYEQGRRIRLLGEQLAPFSIEKHLERLTQGYLRALAEPDPERSGPIWRQLHGIEEQLQGEFDRFAAAFARLPADQTRISRLPLHLPLATRLVPGLGFDARAAFAIHARGIARAVQRRAAEEDPRDAAFTLSAELFLMQHTCHWFCRSKAIASARVLARHKTSYPQLLASVAPETRAAYQALRDRT